MLSFNWKEQKKTPSDTDKINLQMVHKNLKGKCARDRDREGDTVERGNLFHLLLVDF